MRIRRDSGLSSSFFFFNDTATTEIYTLSLHDALPISPSAPRRAMLLVRGIGERTRCADLLLRQAPSKEETHAAARSEEHTSELQSRQYLVCRLLLEKKKK